MQRAIFYLDAAIHLMKEAYIEKEAASSRASEVYQYLGTGVSKEIALQFLEAAQFRGKDSGMESCRKAKNAFEKLGLEYEMIGGSPRLKGRKFDKTFTPSKMQAELEEIERLIGDA